MLVTGARRANLQRAFGTPPATLDAFSGLALRDGSSTRAVPRSEHAQKLRREPPADDRAETGYPLGEQCRKDAPWRIET